MRWPIPIYAETLIHVDLEKVYKTITTASGWDAWFTTGTDFKLVKDHNFEFRWRGWGPRRVDLEAKAKIIDFAHNKFLKFHWNYSLDRGPTEVNIELNDTGNGILLAVTENNYPESDEGLAMFQECSVGWGEAITLLKVYLEKGINYKTKF